MKTNSIALLALGVLVTTAISCQPPREEQDQHREKKDREKEDRDLSNATPGTVFFRGGYETDEVDHGRPVALIAAALGVESEVFRDAFSSVQPARGGGPSAEQARANKKVLMDALGKHGVTNDRLDEVSNYYRYNGAAGEVWKRTPAKATAMISYGKVTGFKLDDPGNGYLNPPEVIVVGHEQIKVKAEISFSEDFNKNGSIASLLVIDAEK